MSRSLIRTLFGLALVLAPIGLTGCESSTPPSNPGGTPAPAPGGGPPPIKKS